MTNRAKIPRAVGLSSLTGLGPVADSLWGDCTAGAGASSTVFLTVTAEVQPAADAVWDALYWNARSIFR